MWFFGKSRRTPPERMANVTVYGLSAVIEGNAYSIPLGTAPRFTDEQERQWREKHKPSGVCYITENVNGVGAILFWSLDRVDAISFLSADDARAYPGFRMIPAAHLLKLDSALEHFPRDRSCG